MKIEVFELFLLVLIICTIFITYYLVLFLKEYIKTMSRADKVFDVLQDSLDTFDKLLVDTTSKLSSLNKLFNVLESLGNNLDYISKKTEQINSLIGDKADQVLRLLDLKEKIFGNDEDSEE